MNTIVVGLDFTGPSRDALAWVAKHIAPGARLVLAHCVNVPEPPRFLRGRFPSPDELAANARLGAQERLDALAAELGLRHVEIRIGEGIPAEVLLDLAQREGAHLLVVGPHAERPGVWRLIGGTALRLARQSPVPVLVARGMADRAPQAIVVAVEDCELTQRVLRTAVTLTSGYGARLHVLHVIRDSLLGAMGVGGSEAEVRDAEASLYASAREWMAQSVAEAGGQGLDVHLEVRAGDAAHQILALADESGADLVVLGRSGTGRVGELILGSVASSVLRNGSGPLLLVGLAAR